MRRAALPALFCCVALRLAAQNVNHADQAGGDLTVALFSTLKVTNLTLSPAGVQAWTARCRTCAHTPLTSPMKLTAPVKLFAGGSVRARDNDSGVERTATGLWQISASSAANGLDVVLTLPSERYVEYVLNAEAAPDEPPQSLQALAIVARTYALNGNHFSSGKDHLPAQLCDSTECQAMRFGATRDAVHDAVRATAGETLWFRGQRAQAMFSQNCGGITAPGAAPYLQRHPDPYCIRHGIAQWHTEVSSSELAAVAAAENWNLPLPLASVSVPSRDESHRARTMEFRSPDGRTTTLPAENFRLGLGRHLGWNRIRSDAYDVHLQNGKLVFDGRGYGHGIGLCQAGAAEMAKEGKSASEILAFYFPGARVAVLTGGSGWNTQHAGAIAVRATTEIPASFLASIGEAWGDTQRRFPVEHAHAPTLTFAPTTELFRQLTGQPGWVLASTSGHEITFQPLAVFRSAGVDIQETIRHEMLHVQVESVATQRAPLWLREGLVEVLAGDAATTSAPGMTDRQIDSALRGAATLLQAQKAHRAAAARVEQLIRRYGMSVVRGWFSTGVPSDD